MIDDAYSSITHYCRNQGKSLAIRNHAFCSYIETLQEALEKNAYITPKVIEATSSALLTDQAMEGYVTRAENFEKQLTQSVIAPLINKQKTEDFWRGVYSSVTGSFLFNVSEKQSFD